MASWLTLKNLLTPLFPHHQKPAMTQPITKQIAFVPARRALARVRVCLVHVHVRVEVCIDEFV